MMPDELPNADTLPPSYTVFTLDELELLAEIMVSDKLAFSAKAHDVLHRVMTKLPAMLREAAPKSGALP
jgi:hypothetical protein